ncbi:AAA domain-containing protein [Mycena rebaudengoi]|nr:AAA domain-containing protein [Mycena rebaudengoi]
MHAYASQQPPVRINQLNYERPILQEHSSLSAFRDTVIQLTENFRQATSLLLRSTTNLHTHSHKVQTGQLAAQLKSIQHHVEKNLGIEPQLLLSARSLLLALSAVMLGTPQTLLRPPTQRNASATLRDTLTSCLTPTPTSMALVRLHTRTARHEGVIYEAHVRGEAALAAALVSLIRKCSPEENIFVATPYKIQRQAVKSALQRTEAAIGGNVTHNVVVDTIERLQGSEATFVICLFSLPHTRNSSLGFLLDRRRLNVAISRAKMLCILITSLEVLRPPINVLTEEGNAKGCAFLRGFEDHAWSCDMKIDLDKY